MCLLFHNLWDTKMKKLAVITLLFLVTFNSNAQEETVDAKEFQGTWFEYYQGFGMNCYTIKKNKTVTWYHEGIREKEGLQKGSYFIDGATISLLFKQDTIYLVYKNGLLFNDDSYLGPLKRTTKKTISGIKKQAEIESGQESHHRIPPSIVGQVALTYKKLEKRFYRGSDGNLYIKTRGLISPPENEGPAFYKEVPDIDVASYEQFSYYAKDKNHVYIDDGTTDGRFINLLEKIDVTSFEVAWYRWGKDKDHVYNNGNLVEGLRVNDPMLGWIKKYKNKFEINKIYDDEKN